MRSTSTPALFALALFALGASCAVTQDPKELEHAAAEARLDASMVEALAEARAAAKPATPVLLTAWAHRLMEARDAGTIQRKKIDETVAGDALLAAIKDLEMSSGAEPSAELLAARGIALLAVRKFGEGSEALRQSLKIRPDFVALEALVRRLAEQQQHSDARKVCLEARKTLTSSAARVRIVDICVPPDMRRPSSGIPWDHPEDVELWRSRQGAATPDKPDA